MNFGQRFSDRMDKAQHGAMELEKCSANPNVQAVLRIGWSMRFFEAASAALGWQAPKRLTEDVQGV